VPLPAFAELRRAVAVATMLSHKAKSAFASVYLHKKTICSARGFDDLVYC
jgi:hypothetical protein